MRLRNVKNAREIVSNHPLIIKKNVFDNSKKLHIEIGCGKGSFIIEMAKRNPDINFIGIEKYESVLVRALEKIENIPSNLRFMCFDAGNIDAIFSKNVDTIYLNFSDPWPKTRHAKRRLTSPIFLELYDKISSGKTHIIMKTDNKGLFAYSLETLNNADYYFNRVSLDFPLIESVPTEYEMKFRNSGETINYLDAIK
jgi:tRNA (guanine-N7-)-methyltransferase